MKWIALVIFATLPIHAEDVSIQTSTGTVYGTLLVPNATTANMPAVVIISGSGPTDRDGNSLLLPGRNDSLKMLAEGLARYGIASIRYDKRGIGASRAAGASESELRFDMYVDDAVAWGQKLRNDRRFSTVSFVGHSEGALIAAIAAQRLPADSVVSISGAGQPAGDLILSQLSGNISPDLYLKAMTIVAALNRGETVSDVPAELSLIFRPSVQPYLISLFRYDPAAEMRKLSMRTLIVQGTTDIQISPDDAQRLAAANPKAKLLLIEGMNHVLKDVPNDAIAQQRSYSDPTLPIDTQLVDAIATFIAQLAKRRSVATH